VDGTARNSGKHCSSGAGYGIKFSVVDRDRYFRKAWQSVFVHLPSGMQVEVSTDKDSFWNESCRELICKEIGQWLIDNRLAPWPARLPPKFNVEPKSERHFLLSVKMHARKMQVGPR
jgi:hypothetical protein